MTRVPSYSFGEEVANSVTHGIGILLSIAGLIVITGISHRHGNPKLTVSCIVFGASLVLLYTTSTLYHFIPRQDTKQLLRLLDHSAIYILIAGTYTPFTLVSLKGSWGWTLFGIIWSLAALGVGFQVFIIRIHPVISVSLYIAMGWTIIIALKPLMASVDTGGLILLFSGGLAYTLGTIFYAWKRLPYHHAVWHIFVLAGSCLHYFAVMFFVIPTV